ncbi:MAG: DUF3048 domain-containing protein [Coriobacteriia bacterium]|nr:DUF3048 domain-containing protein [Coriobacteriia bacterium]MCL2749554.1 DUF3048 domain-containing protein [Coriobacteriia bacterium]
MSKKKKIFVGIAAVAAVLIALAAVFAILSQPTPEPTEEPRVASKGYFTHEVEADEAQVFPLTGLPVFVDPELSDDEQEAALAWYMGARPLCVKIENSRESRPQFGISRADVVYESISEGGITRFNCIFQSTLPEDVGPVRSARNSDISIVPQYQGIMIYSGANPVVMYQMGIAGLPVLTEGASGFHRVDFMSAPHNLFYYLPGGYADAGGMGIPMILSDPPTFEFLPTSGGSHGVGGAPTGATTSSSDAAAQAANPPAAPVSKLVVPFSDFFSAEWTWTGEGSDGRWMRFMDGPTIDGIDEEQIGATNVVVLWAPHTPDAAGGTTWEIALNGSGRASIFTQGGRIDGNWHTDGTTPPRFYDDNGAAIRLTPGNTWFQVLMPGMDISAR